MMKDDKVFSSLHPSLRYVLASWMRWEDLRDIQIKTLQAFETGTDLLILSPTAGGKSEAAFIPILDQIIRYGDNNPVCLYIAPLKALINDMAERLLHILTPLHYDLLVCHGDAPSPDGTHSESPVIILTTPESLMVLLYRRDFSLLSSIRYCIIDELHALAGTERGSQVLAALSRIEERSRSKITRIGLSATIGNPDVVLEWFRNSQKGILVHQEHTPRNHEFHLHSAPDSDIVSILCRELVGKRSLVFTGSRKETEILASAIQGSLPSVLVHHSSLSSDIRKKAEIRTRQGRPFTILCTSTLELGIDIGDLDLVVQTSPPKSVSAFLQRLGRAGRKTGHPVMHCLTTTPEDTCHTLSALMNACSGSVEPVVSIRYPYNLLVREIMLIVLARQRVSKTGIESLLLKKPYQWITKLRLTEILEYLFDYEWLSRDGDLIIPGPSSEQLRRKPDFLFSVIRDQRKIPVITPDGEEIGTVPWNHSGCGDLLLAGSSWEETGREGRDSMVVRPSKKPASPPSWGGSSIEVSRLILSGVQSLVAGKTLPFPVSKSIERDLEVFRKDFPKGLSPRTLSVRYERNQTVIYTFLGKLWNRIIGSFLEKNLRSGCLEYDLYRIIMSDKIPVQIISRSIEMIREGSWENLAEFAAIPSSIKMGEINLLPLSCISEQWCVDHQKIPILIQALRDMEVEFKS